MYERGKGVEMDAAAALASYNKAAEQGNFLGIAFLAQLISRSAHAERAEALWERFFSALADAPEERFLAAPIGEVLHGYLAGQLRRGLEPKHVRTLKRHRNALVAHHQNLLEHAFKEEELARLAAVDAWMSTNLKGRGS